MLYFENVLYAEIGGENEESPLVFNNSIPISVYTNQEDFKIQ